MLTRGPRVSTEVDGEPLYDIIAECPRCHVCAPFGIQVSADVQSGFQGGKFNCVSCDACVLLPDYDLSGDPKPATLDAVRAEAEWMRLMVQSRQYNEFYFLLNLVGGSDTERSLSYLAEVNRLTLTLLSPKPGETSAVVAEHETVLLLQANFEAKAFYATWRNFVNLLIGGIVRPQPWRKDRDEVQVRKRDEAVTFSTSRIIQNLADDLEKVGFVWLATEIRHTHLGIASTIRNALAHATIMFPSHASGGAWVFGEYERDSKGAIKNVEHLMGQACFIAFFKRFMGLRIAASRAFDKFKAELKTAEFDFAAPNQMAPAETIHGHFGRDGLRFKAPSTPPW